MNKSENCRFDRYTLEIIQREGYRREDLTEEHRRALAYLDYLNEKIVGYDAGMIDEEANEETCIGKIKKEIIEQTLARVVKLTEIYIAEIQIGMADAEAEVRRPERG